jgi:hypothetical protein
MTSSIALRLSQRGIMIGSTIMSVMLLLSCNCNSVNAAPTCPGEDGICQNHGWCDIDTGRCHCDNGYGNPDCRLYWHDHDYNAFYFTTLVVWTITLIITCWRFIAMVIYKRSLLPMSLSSNPSSCCSFMRITTWCTIFDTQLTCMAVNVITSILFVITSCLGSKTYAAVTLLIWNVGLALMMIAGSIFIRFFLIIVAKFSPITAKLIRPLEIGVSFLKFATTYLFYIMLWFTMDNSRLFISAAS